MQTRLGKANPSVPQVGVTGPCPERQEDSPWQTFLTRLLWEANKYGGLCEHSAWVGWVRISNTVSLRWPCFCLVQ